MPFAVLCALTNSSVQILINLLSKHSKFGKRIPLELAEHWL